MIQRLFLMATTAVTPVASLLWSVPAQVRAIQEPVTPAFIAVAAGESHTCALTVSGAVKSWGSNDYGQLGDGTTIGRSTLADVPSLSHGVTAVTLGRWHT